MVVPERQEGSCDVLARLVGSDAGGPVTFEDRSREPIPAFGHQLVGNRQQRGLRIREVLVEGGRGGTRSAGDVDDLQIAVRGVDEHRPCLRQELLAGGETALSRYPSVNGTGPFPSDLTSRHIGQRTGNNRRSGEASVRLVVRRAEVPYGSP